MIDNYFSPLAYNASNKVYTHPCGSSIHLGDICSALDMQFLARQRIKTVVTAAAGMDQVKYDNTINHIVYPLLDIKSQNISKLFIQFYELIERQIQKGNILVHCAAGISRSATLVLSYLMRKNSIGFRQAILFVRKERPNICPNLGFERQLKQYEIQLSKRTSTIHHQPQLQLNIERRHISKTSQQRKHITNPLKNPNHNSNQNNLPQISIFGKTHLKSKALQMYGLEEWSKPKIALHSQSNSRHGNRDVNNDQVEFQFYGKKMAMHSKILRSESEQVPKPALSSQAKRQQHYLDQLVIGKLQLQQKPISTERSIPSRRVRKINFP